MQIDHDNLQPKSEGDVEAKILVPFITDELYLGIPSANFFSKEYLAPTEVDKGAKVAGGYYPDFSVWLNGFPVMIVEAKTPGVPWQTAYREACLYARHLNSARPAGFNPTKFVVACSGETIAFGNWDADAEYIADPRTLRPGSSELEAIQRTYGFQALRQHAGACLATVSVIERGTRPFNQAGGQAVLNAKKELNSFAADLSPILRRYFSSTSLTDAKEIAERAYVSAAEVTEYDRVLESLLKDRTQIRKDTIVQRLEPTRRSEPRVSKAIESFSKDRPPQGQMQIIQGSVGAGKSLFIRRYREVLQSKNLRDKTRWAWINFNTVSGDVSASHDWLCNEFINSFREENPDINVDDTTVLRGIFARQIQKRKGIYDDVAASSAEQAARLRAEDMIRWQDDPREFMRGLSHYVLGGREDEILVVVLDNVDRLDLKGQLDAFQLAMWFMEQTKAFIILQMRDETYERFKNKPPLDTFRTGIAFHITPPRFIDVVKRRLALSLEYLSERAEESQTFTLPSGARISAPMSRMGDFLRDLYVELFEKRGNISRILESIAGKDVRRA